MIQTTYLIRDGRKRIDATSDPDRAEAWSRDGYRVTATTTGDDNA